MSGKEDKKHHLAKEYIAPNYNQIYQVIRKVFKIHEVKSGLTEQQEHEQMEHMTSFIDSIGKMTVTAMQSENITDDVIKKKD